MSLWSNFLTWLAAASPSALAKPIVSQLASPEVIPKPAERPPQCGLDLLKQVEGCRLQAYPDQRGIPTIGYGHTSRVKLGDTCTQAQAEQWLVEDSTWAWAAVKRNVSVPLSQNQAAALFSFVFNSGETVFKKSTLLTKLNAGDYAGAASEFKKWCYVGVDGSMKVSDGLVDRRKKETTLFTGGDWRIA